MDEIKIHIASREWAEDEYKKIQRFYSINRHNGNSIRDPEELMKSITDQKAFLITDKKSNELVGVSFCFANGDGDYTESGGTRIIKSGYGLQTVMSFVKSMHEFMRDPPTYEYYCVIKEKNQDSIDNMREACLVEWRPDQRLLDLRLHSPLEGRHFFVLPKVNLANVRDKLLDIVENPVLTSKYGTEALRVDFDIGIIKSGTLSRDTPFDHLLDPSPE